MNLIASQPRVQLTGLERTRAIRKLLALGMTVKDIGDKCCMSESYINYHLRKARMVLLIKPDAVDARLIGTILKIFEDNDFEIRDIRHFRKADHNRLKAHYKEHEGKPFYNGLMDFMVSGPIFAAAIRHTSLGIYEAVPRAREITMSIREQLGSEGPANKLHCSDGPLSSEREYRIWFDD